MIEIKDIRFYQKTENGFFFTGESITKKELVRPYMEFFNAQGNLIKVWGNENDLFRSGFFDVNPNKKYGKSFSLEELNFLSNVFGLEVVNYNNYKDIFDGKIKSLSTGKSYRAEYDYIKKDDKAYIIIFYRRWQHDYQPRGPAEDMLGEDITYIHGIWEDPELPDSIIKKIKS